MQMKTTKTLQQTEQRAREVGLRVMPDPDDVERLLHLLVLARAGSWLEPVRAPDGEVLEGPRMETEMLLVWRDGYATTCVYACQLAERVLFAYLQREDNAW